MRVSLSPLLLAIGAAAAAPVLLPRGGLLPAEVPVGAAQTQYLTSGGGAGGGCAWSVSSARWGVDVPAVLPGDLLSDLAAAGVIPDPWWELTWLNTTSANGDMGAPLWDVGDWTFSCSFDTPLAAAAAPVWLVLDGVKMAADVLLNGAALLSAEDQFLRYVVAVPPGLLRAAGNELSLTFGTSRDPRNRRLSGASGGWDWGALSSTATVYAAVARGPQWTLSKGVWRDIYLAASSDGAILEHVSPLVFYGGAYPQAPLEQARAGPWRVLVRVVLRAGAAGARGELRVAGAWSAAARASVPLALAPGETVAELNLTAAVGEAPLWWPNGLGEPALSAVTASWAPEGGGELVSSARALGFRTFAIVTADDSAPAALAGRDGSGNLTVRWKVNGADIWARGADVIPLEALEGRQSGDAYRALVRSCADAHFNALRVDGIDLIFPAVFYDACDEAGILVYHDAQYSQGNPLPLPGEEEEAELRHTVRKLAHHPSLAVYDGCNECGGHGVYASFVMTTIAAEDGSRPPWPASPSNGWLSGVDRLTSLPNGSPLGLQPTAAAPGAGSRWQLPRRRAPAAAPATQPPAAGCTFLDGFDLCPADPACIGEPHPAAADAPACCAACAAAGAAACGASVFYQGLCWFKPASAAALVGAPGRTLCWPASRPLPPLPTPGPMPTPPDRERHGPYFHGGGWPAVNGDAGDQGFDANMPPALAAAYTVSTAAPGFFNSEFGCVAGSSAESLAPTLAPAHWGLQGGAPADDCVGGFFLNCTGASGLPTNVMAQRNYPLHSIIRSYFGAAVLPSLAEVGLAALQRQAYFGLLAPALQQKSAIEAFRATPTWGTLFWDVNEVWPTGGWGSLEYGPVAGRGFTAGQVVGGRWKPLHYWLASTLYADVLCACGADGRCFVRNDAPRAAAAGELLIEAVSLASGATLARLGAAAVALPAAGAAPRLAWTCLGGGGNVSAGLPCAPRAAVLAAAGCAADGSDCAVRTTLRAAGGGAPLASNLQMQAPPYALRGAPAPRVTAAVGAPTAGGGAIALNVTVAGGAALFVVLTTAAQGRFSDNALPLLPPGTTPLLFLPMLPGAPLDAQLLASTLRVEHLAQYLP